jgi:hypothetical protein
MIKTQGQLYLLPIPFICSTQLFRIGCVLRENQSIYSICIRIAPYTNFRIMALGLTQPPIQWVPRAFTPEVQWLGHEADHSHPSSAKVKNAWSYASTSQYVFMAWCLIKQKIHLHGVVLS